MSQADRVALVGGGLAVTLLEPKWNEVFDEAGFVVEKEEAEEERINLRFGTNFTVQLEKVQCNRLPLITNVLAVLLHSYDGAVMKRRSLGKSVIKKRGKKPKLAPPSKMVDVKKARCLLMFR